RRPARGRRPDRRPGHLRRRREVDARARRVDDAVPGRAALLRQAAARRLARGARLQALRRLHLERAAPGRGARHRRLPRPLAARRLPVRRARRARSRRDPRAHAGLRPLREHAPARHGARAGRARRAPRHGARLRARRKRPLVGGGLVRRRLPRQGRARARGACGARRVLARDARRPPPAARRSRRRRARVPRRRAALASLRDVGLGLAVRAWLSLRREREDGEASGRRGLRPRARGHHAPWLPLAAVGAWRSWRSGERGDGLRLLTVWTLVAYGFLFAAAKHSPRYLVLLHPALALWAALALRPLLPAARALGLWVAAAAGLAWAVILLWPHPLHSG